MKPVLMKAYIGKKIIYKWNQQFWVISLQTETHFYKCRDFIIPVNICLLFFPVQEVNNSTSGDLLGGFGTTTVNNSQDTDDYFNPRADLANPSFGNFTNIFPEEGVR